MCVFLFSPPLSRGKSARTTLRGWLKLLSNEQLGWGAVCVLPAAWLNTCYSALLSHWYAVVSKLLR